MEILGSDFRDRIENMQPGAISSACTNSGSLLTKARRFFP